MLELFREVRTSLRVRKDGLSSLRNRVETDLVISLFREDPWTRVVQIEGASYMNIQPRPT